MKQKNYAPVTPFERQTSHCPLYVAWVVLDEARDYFRTNWVPSRKKHLIRPADTFSPSDAEKENLRNFSTQLYRLAGFGGFQGGFQNFHGIKTGPAIGERFLARFD